MSLELDLPIRTEPTKPSRSNKPKPVEVVEEEITKEITREFKASKKEKTRREQRSPRKFRLVAIFTAVALGIGAWWTMLGPGSRVTVPSLIGGTLKQADKVLTPLGLTSEITKQEFSEEIEKGIIIQSDPEGGGKIKEGGVVKLILSKGPERYQIPNLEKLTINAATKLLTSLPLDPPVIEEVFNEKIPKGYVIGTEPKAGSQVKRGAGIKIIVSKGIEQVPLNNFIGKIGEEALNTLVEAGFKVVPKYSYSETVPSGAVISQEPNTEKEYPKGSKVNIVISKGSAYVFIPNVFSLTESKAKTLLTDLGLKVDVKRMGTKAIKKVTAISPKLGSKVLRGSKVTITVG
jgi:serine/threonine-protein kinase